MAGRITDNKAAMTTLKTKIRSEITVLTANLMRNVSRRSLERNLARVWEDWETVEQLYQTILILTDNVEDETERTTHLAFQTELFQLRDQVQDVIATAREAEETRKNLSHKDGRLRTFGKKWTAAYHRIDTVLEELKTRLTDGDPITSLEVLEHKSARLAEVREQLDVADTNVDALFATEPDQITVTVVTQGEKRTAAEVVIDECKDRIRTFRTAIEMKAAAEKAATD